jgi:hypothetical protein
MAIFNSYVKLPEGNTAQKDVFAKKMWMEHDGTIDID